MRKLTFLWALLLCTGAAFAQVSELSELSNEKAYLLHNPNGFGYAYYNSSKSTSTLWLAEATAKSGDATSFADESYGATLDKTTVGAYFQVLTVDGKNYLYSLGAKKFVKTRHGAVELVDLATPITIQKTSNGFAFNSDPSQSQWYMCAATHMSNPIEFWTSDDLGSSWEIVEKDVNTDVADMPDMQEGINKARFYDVTYNYTVTDVDNSTFSRTVSQAVNSAYDPTTDFLADYQFTAGTVSADGENVVNVTCRTDFPFVPTTLEGGNFAADTHWYMLDVNNNANWFVYTDGDAVKVNGTNTDAEAYYWCFVRKTGTYNEFSLYNMKTGAEKPLTIQWTTAWQGSTTQPYNQAPATMATGGTNTTTFRITENGEGLNIQMPATGIDGVLPANIGHHKGDVFTVYQGGSSSTVPESRVFVKNSFTGTAASRLEEHKNSINLSALEQTKGYVGSYSAAQVDALSACTTLAEWTAIVSNPITIEEGKYYRIVSAATTQPRGDHATIYPKRGTTGSYTSSWEEGTDAASDAFSIWQFEAATNGSGQAGYKIKNVNLGKYFGRVGLGSTAATMVEESEATVYRTGFYEGVVAQAYFTHQTNADISAVGNSNKGTYIFCDNSNVDGWEGGANSNSAWYLIPASTLKLTMHTVDNTDYYSTLYLPFGVTPQEGSGVTAYRATANGTSLVLNAIEGGVPANTGVILKGTGGECVLNIADEVPALTDPNQLEGTCEIQENITKADYFVLGAANNKVGFYRPNATTLAANRAYLPASAVPATTGLLSFAFGEMTGIGAVETTAESAEPVYYDLSGRRVLRPGKGIYVKNGRKVLVR